MFYRRTSTVFRLLAASAVALACSASVKAETFLIPEGDVAALQSALDQAANNEERDFIDLQGNVFTLIEPQPGTNSGLVVLAESNVGLDVSTDIWIENGTIERSTAAGTPDFRLVDIIAPLGAAQDFFESDVNFRNLVFRNGRLNAGNVSSNSTGGGAIQTDWNTAIFDSSFQNNSVLGNGSGGAIRATSDLSIRTSEFIENTALSSFEGTVGRGGAVYTNDRTVITRTLFERNRANFGGAYFDDHFDTNIVIIEQSLFTANSATNLGGGIWSRSRRLSVENSTLFDNSASGGGAIYSQRPDTGESQIKFTVEYSTIVNNRATSGIGGGILSAANFFNGLEFISSIVGGNTGVNGETNNCAVINNEVSVAPVTSSISDDASCNSGLGVFTMVDDIYTVVERELSGNGGSTQTLALTENSLAIDASTAVFCPATDQRRVLRQQDNTGNACDIGAYEMTLEVSEPIDSDGDGIPDESIDGQLGDNCPAIGNNDQLDSDLDGLGDVCDADRDGDGVPQFDADTEASDNCPDLANENQQDTDNDGLGDICDTTPNGDDADADGIGDIFDNCPAVNSEDLTDTDGDGLGNVCDDDDDGDLVLDVNDAFPLDPSESIDTDGDGTGNNADTDDDSDGRSDNDDNCSLIANPNQEDIDSDGTGDVCDETDNRIDTDDDEQGNIDASNPVNLNSWGSGFNASFEYVITDADTAGGSLREWRVEIDTNGGPQIINAWINSGYNAAIRTSTEEDLYILGNEGQGYIDELIAGDVLAFTIQGSGSDYNSTGINLNFISVSQDLPSTGSCDNPISVTLPFSFNGAGEHCWVISGTASTVNSWATDSVEINGSDFTNRWSNSLPGDGPYTVLYDSDVSWGHFEMNGSN